MRRLTSQPECTTVGIALGLLPEGWRHLVEDVDVAIGIDPAFVGLHDYDLTTFDFDDEPWDAHYKDLPHIVGEEHQWMLPISARCLTVVLPLGVGVKGVVHELGHVLCRLVPWSWTPAGCTPYGRTDREEAFAEAVSSWCVPAYEPDYWDRDSEAIMRNLEVAA